MQVDLDSLMKRAELGNAAGDELFAALYDELHRLAESTLRRDGDALTLGTTTLLHEAYLKISGRQELAFENRARFFAYASRAMRSLVIDFARSRRAIKRDAGREVTLDDDGGATLPLAGDAHDPESLVRIGDAMGALGAIDPSLVELVDLHFFGGFSFAEIAGFRGVSERTVQRDWRKARMLLRESMQENG